MILWTIKQVSNVRQAIAGRKYPHQLAWAVAFGVLLGVVPHGNLLAIAILLVVLSLKLNHAMAGLTAVLVTFGATQLDPYSHEVGNFVLTHPQLSEATTTLWELPLVPWTDLNNTVVMGSFLLGLGALLPIFVITYPIFRLMAPQSETDPDDRRMASQREQESSHEVIMVDQGHSGITSPHRGPSKVPQYGSETSSYGAETSSPQATESESPDDVEFVEVDRGLEDEQPDNCIAVETRIDVIRMMDHRSATPESASQQVDASDEQQPMDEALNYLLRQLRDSQQRKAA
jgi:uncharacterized protein (TIGR03546 family)